MGENYVRQADSGRGIVLNYSVENAQLNMAVRNIKNRGEESILVDGQGNEYRMMNDGDNVHVMFGQEVPGSISGKITLPQDLSEKFLNEAEVGGLL